LGASRFSPPHAPPLYQTVGYVAADLSELAEQAQGERYFYARHGAPNEDAAAELLAELEGYGLKDAEKPQAVLLGSGMAAIEAAVTAAVQARTESSPAETGGRRVPPRLLVASPLYSASEALLRALAARGFFELYEAKSDDAVAELSAKLDEPGGEVAAIYCEALCNPRLRVADLPALSALARRCGAELIVDATFITPLWCRPLHFGASLVVHSATKFLGGHGDVCAGVVIGKPALVERARLFRKLHGAVLDPFAAWLLQRSLRTLAVRLERQAQNAAGLAAFLSEHAEELGIREVIYPGLPSHPDHALAARLFTRPGAMLSFVVKSEAAARRVYENVRVLRRVASLGDVETLIMYPAAAWKTAMSAARQKELGITPELLRLSVGIEDLTDLQSDLSSALKSRPQ
jgi:cystathionine beta-lyase/cystathionine gamma-synthase